jgi:hypothetical protein
LQGLHGLQGLLPAQGLQGLAAQGLQGLFAPQGLQGLQGLLPAQGLQGLQALQAAAAIWTPGLAALGAAAGRAAAPAARVMTLSAATVFLSMLVFLFKSVSPWMRARRRG